jgi:hypothetical protein
MRKPTQTEIQAEINKLEDMKPRVLRRSFFGDDHHAAIEFQIEILQGDVDRDEVEDKLDNGEIQQNVFDAGREALDWMEGEIDDTPSDSWKTLIR